MLRDYNLTRASDEGNWYHLRIYTDSQQIDYAMSVKARILIEDGKIKSINGNGLSHEVFRQARIKLYAFRSFNRGKENEVLGEIEKMVCGS